MKSNCNLPATSSFSDMGSQPLRMVVTGAGVIIGGLAAFNLVSSVAIGALRFTAEAKRKKVALPCGICQGKGFYICRLCKGNANIQWSHPLITKLSLCPTCDGNREQRCLNCIGKGYI